MRFATGWPSWAGRCGTRPRAPGSCRRAEMADRRSIYGKQPVAEAERGRRRVHRVWRAPETSAEELERLCGSPDHQGVVAEVDPYPYADPRGLLREEDALLVALDQVQDPRNLGAVCRSAEFAGAAGVVIPERRSAEVTAVACKASAGAVEHLRDRPRPQPRRLAGRGEGGRLLDLGRRRRGRRGALGRRPHRPDRARPGRRGQGICARAWRPPATASSPCRSGARSSRSTSPRPPRRCFSRRVRQRAEPRSTCNGGCTKSQFGVDRTPRGRKLPRQQG